MTWKRKPRESGTFVNGDVEVRIHEGGYNIKQGIISEGSTGTAYGAPFPYEELAADLQKYGIDELPPIPKNFTKRPKPDSVVF